MKLKINSDQCYKDIKQAQQLRDLFQMLNPDLIYLPVGLSNQATEEELTLRKKQKPSLDNSISHGYT